MLSQHNSRAKMGVVPANGDRGDQSDGERFHWIPLTVVYWLVSGVLSLLYSSWWALLAAWLATPLVIVIGYCVFLAILRRRPAATVSDETRLSDQRRDDRNAA